MKNTLVCLLPLLCTFHYMKVICLPLEHNVIYRIFWGPIRYYASHGMPMEARVAPLGRLSTL